MIFGKIVCGAAAAVIISGSLPAAASAEPVLSVTAEREYKSSFTQGNLRFSEKDDGTLEVFAAESAKDTIKNAVIPETVNGKSVTSIGYEAFIHCRSLTSVTIPNSISLIDGLAFMDCGSLASVTIPDSVKTIGAQAFWGCDSLTSVTIPRSVTSLGGGAFINCGKLTSITVDPKNPYYYNNNTGVLFENRDGEKVLVQYPAGKTNKTYSVPNGVISIDKYAFGGCGSLVSVTIPNSVTSIGEYAFGGCGSLASVTIPNSVAAIGGYAFQYCGSLTSVTIPAGVISIGNNPFSNCVKLNDIYYGGSQAQWNTLIEDSEWDGKIAHLDDSHRWKELTPTIHFDPSAPVEVTKPAAPSSATALKPTANSVTLTWGKINGASSYIIMYSPDGGKTWTSKTTPDNMIALFGLKPSTAYIYKIAAKKGAVEGEFTQEYTFETASLPEGSSDNSDSSDISESGDSSSEISEPDNPSSDSSEPKPDDNSSKGDSDTSSKSDDHDNIKDNSDLENNSILWVLIIALIAVAGAVVGVVVLKKKKP